MDTMNYEFGDWVVYDPGYTSQIGRVTECRETSAFVCYSSGCTAASTPLKHLRPAMEDEIAGADPMIGHNRFHEFCPEYDELCCVGCKARKVVAE